MNDRFKFRVWDKGNEHYVDYADLLYIEPSGEITYACYDSDREDMYYYEQDDVVIEQCTGLKDKNGKLIYEGDIIEKQNQKFVIKYEFDSFVAYSEEKKPVSIYGLFAFKLCFGGWPEKETENTIEVIGNIHENPELLEQNNDNR